LPGGGVHGIYRLHKVAKETMCDSVWMVVDATNNHPDYQIALPFDDEEKWRTWRLASVQKALASFTPVALVLLMASSSR